MTSARQWTACPGIFGPPLFAGGVAIAGLLAAGGYSPISPAISELPGRDPTATQQDVVHIAFGVLVFLASAAAPLLMAARLPGTSVYRAYSLLSGAIGAVIRLITTSSWQAHRVVARGLPAALAGLVVFALPGIGSAEPDTDLKAISQAYTEAFNRHDNATLLAMVTDDYVQEGGGCMDVPDGKCTGKAAYEHELQSSAGSPQLTLTVVDQQVHGSIIDERVELRFTPNVLAPAGADHIVALARSVVRGSKIASLKIVDDLSDDTTARVSLGPGAPPPVRARDGQALAAQSSATRQAFVAVWGVESQSRWITEHEAALAH